MNRFNKTNIFYKKKDDNFIGVQMNNDICVDMNRINKITSIAKFPISIIIKNTFDINNYNKHINYFNNKKLTIFINPITNHIMLFPHYLPVIRLHSNNIKNIVALNIKNKNYTDSIEDILMYSYKIIDKNDIKMGKFYFYLFNRIFRKSLDFDFFIKMMGLMLISAGILLNYDKKHNLHYKNLSLYELNDNQKSLICNYQYNKCDDKINNYIKESIKPLPKIILKKNNKRKYVFFGLIVLFATLYFYPQIFSFFYFMYDKYFKKNIGRDITDFDYDFLNPATSHNFFDSNLNSDINFELKKLEKFDDNKSLFEKIIEKSQHENNIIDNNIDNIDNNINNNINNINLKSSYYVI